MREFDLVADDGTSLHCYDTGSSGHPDEVTVVWHAGSPNVGEPPQPLFAAAGRLHLRWVGYDRPGYGGSPRHGPPAISDGAQHTRLLVDRLGVHQFAVVGHSGGGPRALACAALLPDRVVAAVAISSPAPILDAADLDYFDGMNAGHAWELRAAMKGADALANVLAGAEENTDAFTDRDLAALDGEWSWFEHIVAAATEHGTGGLVDDDLALVGDWGFRLHDATAPTLLIHGTADKVIPYTHSRWLHDHLPTSTLRLEAGHGHISVLSTAEDALVWTRDIAESTPDEKSRP